MNLTRANEFSCHLVKFYLFVFFFSFPTIWVFLPYLKNFLPPVLLIFLFPSSPFPLFFQFFSYALTFYFFYFHPPFVFFYYSLLNNLFLFCFHFSSIFALCFFPSFFVPTPQFSFFLLLAFFFLPLLNLANIFPLFLLSFFPFFSHSTIFFFFTSHCSYCHFMPFPPMPFWATEKIWLPFNIPPLSYGNWNFLVAQEVKCEMNFFFPNDSTYPNPF